MPIVDVILAPCDYSGRWTQPYHEAGYRVIQIDLKRGQDVRWFQHAAPYVGRVAGVIAAPPCTDFSGSGAQYWPQKDADGRTLQSLALIDACLRLVAIYNPCFWVLENPVGRLKRWLGPPRMYVQPHWYAGHSDAADYRDRGAYTKKTGLWGEFNAALPRADEAPVRECAQGSWVQQLGGKSERTRELRSMTPMGFARAFFLANNPLGA